MRKALLIAPHGPARLFGLRVRDGRLRYAHDQSAEQTQQQRGVGVAHPAVILAKVTSSA